MHVDNELELEPRTDPSAILELKIKAEPILSAYVVLGYLGAAEEVGLILIKLIWIILFATLPAVTLH